LTTTDTFYIGPQTIMVGDQQSMPFFILAGGSNLDILTINDILLDRTITTTDTYLNTLTYQIVVHVPEPASLTLLGLGGLFLAWHRQRCTLSAVRCNM
jgi:hypothetical protein